MKVSWSALIVMVILAVSMIGGQVAMAQNCGSQANGKTCGGGQCCSQWGWCGKTPAHCGSGCQSQCSRRAAEADAEPADAEKATAAGQP